MGVFEHSGAVAVIMFVVNVIFFAGMWFAKLRNAVTRQEVTMIINKEVKKQLSEHCPFSDDIAELKNKGLIRDEDDKAMAIVKIKDDKAFSAKLNQIDFNVRNMCEHLQVKYIGEKNGTR